MHQQRVQFDIYCASKLPQCKNASQEPMTTVYIQFCIQSLLPQSTRLESIVAARAHVKRGSACLQKLGCLSCKHMSRTWGFTMMQQRRFKSSHHEMELEGSERAVSTHLTAWLAHANPETPVLPNTPLQYQKASEVHCGHPILQHQAAKASTCTRSAQQHTHARQQRITSR